MDLKAELYLVNKKSDGQEGILDTGLQNDIAGKELKVTITFTPSNGEKCTVAKTAG